MTQLSLATVGAILIAASYLVGNLSPATLMGKIHGIDIRREGSGNPGTTNVLRQLGIKAAAVTLIGDILKGLLPVILGTIAIDSAFGCVCGTAAFVGHIWPVRYQMHGGKGVATGFGVLLGVNWAAALLCLLAAALGVLIFRRMSVGSIIAAIAVPVTLFFLQPAYTLWGIALMLVVLWRHRTNIRRLIRGKEPKMHFSKKKIEEEKQLQRSIEKRTVAVMGAGSWGTAVAVALSVNGHDVRLWGRNTEMLAEMQQQRENKKYLPDVKLADNIFCTSKEEEAMVGAEMVVYVVPAQSFRSTFERTRTLLSEDTIIVNCSKGIETDTLKRISEIAAELYPKGKFAVLSGPSHAEEVGKHLPTTLVAASKELSVAEYVQDAFMSESLRVYTNQDVAGVEIGGALKNIIALAAGISDGMGYGDNLKAALMTRSLTEIARLGKTLGAERGTFMGLAGIGDLIVTCTSMHSRNRRCGILIGQGVPPAEAIEQVGMVVEGIYTTKAAHAMAQKYGIEMPITEQLYRVIQGEISGHEAVKNLMLRSKKSEEV